MIEGITYKISFNNKIPFLRIAEHFLFKKIFSKYNSKQFLKEILLDFKTTIKGNQKCLIP